ncbi:MAG: PQQ-dependent sugar dehydrogenase [Phycisphaerales bacterium]
MSSLRRRVPFATLAATLLAAPALAQSPAAKPAAPAAKPATPATAPAAKPAAPKPMPQLKLQRVCPEVPLRRPVQVLFEPGNDGRMYVLEQPGRILLLDPSDRDTKEGKVFLDFRPKVNSRGNEEGLLAMAFHPDFAKNGTFFLYYTAMDESKKRTSVLSRWKLDPETKMANPESEEVLLSVDQPFSNHNGGTILFGKDGKLYLSFGDGGAANDPQFNGQNLGTLLAKIIRIDVDKTDGDLKYGIPQDNPFVKVANARPEIWAFGLRNVWRMSFDRKTGELYAADVGQNAYEEVDIVTKGGNYGWNPREGLHEFPGGKPGSFGSEYIDPVVEYPHDQGVSITGGYVYRGDKYPALDGVYLYADLVTTKIWGIRAENGKLVAGPEVLAQTRNQLPTSFGEANDGTIFMTTFEGSQDARAKGAIWRIVPSGS